MCFSSSIELQLLQRLSLNLCSPVSSWVLVEWEEPAGVEVEGEEGYIAWWAWKGFTCQCRMGLAGSHVPEFRRG